MAGDRYVERSIIDVIMYALMQLSGQEYVDEYAADVKRSRGGSGARPVRELGDRIPGSRAS
jgi:1-acyl-sn-glycerol-3-phosphate acyltransferase